MPGTRNYVSPRTKLRRTQGINPPLLYERFGVSSAAASLLRLACDAWTSGVRPRAAASALGQTDDPHARRVKHPAVTTVTERSAWPTVQLQGRLARCRSGRTRSSAPRDSAGSWVPSTSPGSRSRSRAAIAFNRPTPPTIDRRRSDARIAITERLSHGRPGRCASPPPACN